MLECQNQHPSFPSLLYSFSQIEMMTEKEITKIIWQLVALSVCLISLAIAVEVCALSQGTDGTHEVLIPDPQASISDSVICSSAKAKAVEVCALSLGTDGTHEVLIPDPQASISESVICSSTKAVEACYSHGTFYGSHELLIPDRQSSIPSDVPTTPPSATGDRAPLDVVNSDGEDDDPCGDGGDHPAMAAGICRNDCVAELLCPALTTLVTLLNFQPRGDSSLSDTWSPSRSTSSPPPPPTSSLSPSASFPIIMVQLAFLFGFTVNLIGWLMFRRGRVEIVLGFAVSLIGWMMLRRGRVTAANLCRCVGLFLVAVAFFSMTYRFVPDHLAWAARAAAAVLALVFAYSLG